MREDRKFLQMIVGPFEIKRAAEDSLPSAAIEQIPRFDCWFSAVERFDVDLHPIVGEIELRHLGFLTDFRAILSRMIEQ